MIAKVDFLVKKISFVTPKISFKGSYNTVAEDIDIENKNIGSKISSVSGDINVEHSVLNNDIKTISGNINLEECQVKGNIKSVAGNIRIYNDTKIKGNIQTTNGNVKLHNSELTGDIKTQNGNIILKDSYIDGTIESYIDSLKLKGENKIKKLYLKDSGGGNISITNGSISISNLRVHDGCIFISGNNNSINGINVIDMGNKVVKTPEFTLPTGTKILEFIKFDTSKPGILFLENGAEVLGKIINGVIKRI